MQSSALTNIKQLPVETLRAYIQRFTEEASKTKVDDGQCLVALQSGIRAGSPLWDDMQRNKAATLKEFIRRAQRSLHPYGVSLDLGFRMASGTTAQCPSVPGVRGAVPGAILRHAPDCPGIGRYA